MFYNTFDYPPRCKQSKGTEFLQVEDVQYLQCKMFNAVKVQMFEHDKIVVYLVFWIL